MKGRPLIGITCGVQIQGPIARAGGSIRYAEAILAAGGLPVYVPPMAQDAALALLERLDGLLLTGGGDLDPDTYGEKPLKQVSYVEPARDETELALAREAMRTGMATLGICRGLQVINVAAGGTLIQDLPTQRRSDVRHQQTAARFQSTHSVALAAESLLADVSGQDQMEVNSFHHQAVRDLGVGLHACAWAPDGVVEGIEKRDGTFVLGVQWHPEELWDQHPPSFRLFARLVEEARRGRRVIMAKTASPPPEKEESGRPSTNPSFRLR